MGNYFSSFWSSDTSSVTYTTENTKDNINTHNAADVVTSVIIEPRDPPLSEAKEDANHRKENSNDSNDYNDDIVIRPDCIIGLAGHMSSGKDTFATVLEQTIKNDPRLKDCPIYRIAFADPIKDLICEVFDVSRGFLETNKRTNHTPAGFQRPIRELLQHVGDLRTFNPNVWVDALLRKLPNDGIVIVTDVRYHNEMEALKSRGAYVALLSRHYDISKRDEHAHSSEQCLQLVYKEVATKEFPHHLTDHPLVDLYIKNDLSSTDLLSAASRRILDQHIYTE